MTEVDVDATERAMKGPKPVPRSSRRDNPGANDASHTADSSEFTIVTVTGGAHDLPTSLRRKEPRVLDPQRDDAIVIDKRTNGVDLATLNRPDPLNAVNATMHSELARLTRDVDVDPTVKVLVITGRVAPSAPAATSVPSPRAAER